MFRDGLFYSVVKAYLVLNVGKLLLQYGNLIFYIRFVFGYQGKNLIDMTGDIFIIMKKLLHFGDGHAGIFETLDGMETSQVIVIVDAVFPVSGNIGKQPDVFIVAQGGCGDIG